MELFKLNASRISTLVTKSMGVGTPEAKEALISPKNLLERIVNFFTFGALCKTRTEQVADFTNTLAAVLNDSLIYPRVGGIGQYSFPEDIAFSYCGHEVKFTLPREDSKTGLVRVYVRQNSKCISAALENETFHRVCTSLIVRLRNHLDLTKAPLTEDGRINLRDENLNDANLQMFNLAQADLSNAQLAEANLNYTNLRGADLTNAILTRTYLMSAQLQGATLRMAKLDGTNLVNADLYQADLCDAQVRKVDIRGANFKEADLQGIITANNALLEPPIHLSNNASNNFLRNCASTTSWTPSDYDLLNQAIDSIEEKHNLLKNSLMEEYSTQLFRLNDAIKFGEDVNKINELNRSQNPNPTFYQGKSKRR